MTPNSIRIPIHLTQIDQVVETLALVDSGAAGIFINQGIVDRYHLKTTKLKKSIQVHNVDGTENQQGLITHQLDAALDIEGTQDEVTFLVTNLGREHVILGLPWLRKENPKIDWTQGLIEVGINLVNDEEIFTTMPIAKMNPATELARSATQRKNGRPLIGSIPTEYLEFRKAFEKPDIQKLPPRRTFDHAIDLKEEFVPKSFKAYSLNIREEAELDEFIQENLEKGFIRPSKSPMASPFFFVPKKDGKSRSCQDYRYLNEGTIKNAYPLPKIEDLIDELKEATIFTKVDVRAGYNNVRIKKGDEWKAAFRTPKGLYEPTVMFFGLCNSPATFQAMMNEYTKDMVAEGWMVIYMDDILIFSKDKEEHRLRTQRMLQRLIEKDLYLKPEKCFFDRDEVEFLGMIIGHNQVKMDPVKIQGILE